MVEVEGAAVDPGMRGLAERVVIEGPVLRVGVFSGRRLYCYLAVAGSIAVGDSVELVDQRGGVPLAGLSFREPSRRVIGDVRSSRLLRARQDGRLRPPRTVPGEIIPARAVVDIFELRAIVV